MSRRAFVLPTVLLAAGAIGLLATTILAGAAQRTQQSRQHQARIQGREWCLGARTLPPGTVLAIDGWRIMVGEQRVVSASDQRGTYRIAADGRESWERSP
jgi:hypothetical protein